MELFKFSGIIVLLQVVPSLVGATCRYPGSPAHSRVTFSDDRLEEGTVATYTCEQGFELLGPSRRICDAGRWMPDGVPFCVINVAAGKAPMQSSTDEGGVPQRALDGSTSSTFRIETCTLTKVERVPWWYVNLLEPYMVQVVRLDFGKPTGLNTPATIVVRVGNNRPDEGRNPICNRFTGFLEEGQPLFLPCNPPMPGAFVSVHLEAAIPSQLSICEAFVYTDQALPIERCPQFRDQPPGSTATYNGKCYIFYDRQPANFREALSVCRSKGGTLVDESNPALQGFISWELWRRHRSDSSSQYWIGAVRDPQDPTNWKWVNGKDVTISFWSAPGWSDFCAKFDGSKGWLWSDTECESTLNYICQHQPQTCGRPEQPPNSTISTESFEVGAAVEYSCDEGHLLVGPTVRNCLDTGFYDGFPPLCKPVQCEQPPTIPNGRVAVSNNASVFGSFAEYTCFKGFKLQGARKIKCLAVGLWDKAAPHCYPEERITTTTTIKTTTTTTRTIIHPSTPVSTTQAPTTPVLILPTRQKPQRPLTPHTHSIPLDLPTTARPHERVPATERSPNKTHEKLDVRKVTVSDIQDSTTASVPRIIVANLPRENHIQTRAEQTTRMIESQGVDGGRREAVGGRENIIAIASVAVFAILVLVTIIVVIMIIMKRKSENARNRRYLNPEIMAIESIASSCESPNEFKQYYQRAWDDLANSPSLRHGRHAREAPKDGSELVVADVYPAPQARDKPRKHHHHHHHESASPPTFWRPPLRYPDVY